MKEVGAFDAQNTLSSLLDGVQQGEEVIITRYGKRVARLVPERRVGDRTNAQAAVIRIRHRAAMAGREPIAVEEWRQLVDESRR